MRLPPALSDADYETPGLPGLSKVMDWKARILFGKPKDIREKNKADVGYVMVNVKDDTVIPIARPDEHRRGYATLRDMAKKWKIDPRDYRPVFRHGPYYLDDVSEIPDALIVVRKWRDAGGPNLVVEHRPRTGDNGQVLTMDDFLRAGGLIEVESRSLLPIGERFVRALENVAAAIRRAGDGIDERKVAWSFASVDRLLAVIETHWSLSSTALKRWDDERFPIQGLRRDLEVWRSANDLRALENAVFGFGTDWVGLKRGVHDAVRSALVEPEDWRSQGIAAVFGDLNFAFDRLGRIGAGPNDAPTTDASEPDSLHL